MKLHQETHHSKSELELLGAEIQKMRQPGRLLVLPDDLKVRILRLRDSGVTFSDIRRVTGVQANSVKSWSKKLATSVKPRPFRVVKLSEELPQAPAPQILTFRYASGKVTLDIAFEELTPELLRVLTSC